MRSKNFYVLCLISILLHCNCLFALQPKASPKPKINYIDSLKVKEFIKLGWKIASLNPIKANSCANLAYYYSHAIKWKNGETEALLLKARALDYLGKSKEALPIDLLALKTSIELKDSILIARSLRQTAGIFITQSKIDLSIQLLKTSIEISRKINDINGLGSALTDLGSIYFAIAKYNQAIVLLKESILFKIAIKDSINLSNSYRKLSDTYFEMGLYEESIDFVFKSIKLSSQTKNLSEVSNGYYLLGMLYTNTKDYYKSLTFLKEALAIKKNLQNKEEIGMVYTRIGKLYSTLGQSDSAFVNLRNAIFYLKENGKEHLLSINNSEMGKLFLQLQNYDSTNFYLEKSLKYDSTENSIQFLIEDYLLLSKNNYLHKKYTKAQTYLQKVNKLIDSAATLSNQSNYAELQSLIYDKFNRHNEALVAYKKYIVLRDSILNKDKKTSMALKDARFEFDSKAMADSIKNLEQQRAMDRQIKLQLSQLKTQKIKQYALSAGLLLLASIGWLLYSRYKAVNKQRRAEQQLQLYEKSRALEGERRRIASEIHDDVWADLSNLLLKIRMNEKLSETASTADLGSLKKTTNNLIYKIDEIIWSLNSERDTLRELINFTTSYFETLLSENNLKGNIHLPAIIPEAVLSADLRRNIFLTLKEIGNNALKFANAQAINLSFNIQQNKLYIVFNDDGKGFNTNQTSTGNGIKNIYKRLESCKGTISINSNAQTGTSYMLIFPLI